MFDEDFSQKATVTGTGEAGATITITNAKGEIIGSGTADRPSGAFSIPVDAPNTGGRQSLTVTQQIGDDNGGSANVDAQYGAAVTITSPVDGAHHDGGQVTVGDAGLTGSVVKLYEGEQLLGQQTVENGSYSITTTNGLDDDRHELRVEQLGKGANTTTASVTLNADGKPTAPLSIDTPVDGSTVEPDSKRVVFSGTGESGARVQVKTQTASPRTIIDTYVGADGKWSQLGGDLNFDVNYVLESRAGKVASFALNSQQVSSWYRRSYIGMSRDILDVHTATARPSLVCFPPAQPPSRGLS